MTEDAERLEDIGAEEDTSEPDIAAEEPIKEIEVKEKKERKPISNPLGFIFNLRMLRRFIQIGFFLAINAYIFVSWFHMPNVTRLFVAFRDILPTLPILSPLEAPYAVIAGSFDTIQQTFTTGLFPFFTLGAMVIILIFVGRAPCGWICPLGTIQDFVTLPKRKKVRPSPGTEKELRKVKIYIFVIVAGLAVWLGFARVTGTAASLEAALSIFANDAFAPLNPANILFAVLFDPALLWPTGFSTLWYLSTWGFVLVQVVFVAIVFVISFWVPRWFCRWLCPAGWLYSIFSREALLGIGRNPARCTPDTCNVCEVVCPMNIRIRKFPYQHMHSPDCIMCMDCKSHCPNNAIVLRFS
ncbi:4Fe-4S binding protein [Candidatus Thorarchaeota archaeon]|nr:MAG: 4Fe-4S binding protein [Candidatus Thorarchaeota archaeon]